MYVFGDDNHCKKLNMQDILLILYSYFHDRFELKHIGGIMTNRISHLYVSFTDRAIEKN